MVRASSRIGVEFPQEVASVPHSSALEFTSKDQIDMDALVDPVNGTDPVNIDRNSPPIKQQDPTDSNDAKDTKHRRHATRSKNRQASQADSTAHATTTTVAASRISLEPPQEDCASNELLPRQESKQNDAARKIQRVLRKNKTLVKRALKKCRTIVQGSARVAVDDGSALASASATPSALASRESSDAVRASGELQPDETAVEQEQHVVKESKPKRKKVKRRRPKNEVAPAPAEPGSPVDAISEEASAVAALPTSSETAVLANTRTSMLNEETKSNDSALASEITMANTTTATSSSNDSPLSVATIVSDPSIATGIPHEIGMVSGHPHQASSIDKAEAITAANRNISRRPRTANTQTQAATRIQATYRGHQGRLQSKHRLREVKALHKSAVRIQAQVRGHLARVHLDDTKSTDQHHLRHQHAHHQRTRKTTKRKTKQKHKPNTHRKKESPNEHDHHEQSGGNEEKDHDSQPPKQNDEHDDDKPKSDRPEITPGLEIKDQDQEPNESSSLPSELEKTINPTLKAEVTTTQEHPHGGLGNLDGKDQIAPPATQTSREVTTTQEHPSAGLGNLDGKDQIAPPATQTSSEMTTTEAHPSAGSGNLDGKDQIAPPATQTGSDGLSAPSLHAQQRSNHAPGSTPEPTTPEVVKDLIKHEDRAEKQQPNDTKEKEEKHEEQVWKWPALFNLEPSTGWPDLTQKVSRQHDHKVVQHALAPAQVASSFQQQERDQQQQHQQRELTVATKEFLLVGKLRVFCGTWNLHGKIPREQELQTWIPVNRFHIVAVGTEECGQTIAKSVVFISKAQWEARLKTHLGEEYVQVASHTLTAIHNTVFVHQTVLPWLSQVHSYAVATGLGNHLGNKGGVGIGFCIGETRFAFVNCHFAAHQNQTRKRNANFHRIDKEMRLFAASTYPNGATAVRSSCLAKGSLSSAKVGALPQPSTSPSGSANAIFLSGPTAEELMTTRIDRVFWYGDLNYRINGTRKMVDSLIDREMHDVLLGNDQLKLEMSKHQVFDGFDEGPLHFFPTFKFDVHSDRYDSSSKQRIPSWTDRVLFKVNPRVLNTTTSSATTTTTIPTHALPIALLCYKSSPELRCSDHRPVCGIFDVEFEDSQSKKHLEESETSTLLAKGYHKKQKPTKSEICVVS